MIVAVKVTWLPAFCGLTSATHRSGGAHRLDQEVHRLDVADLGRIAGGVAGSIGGTVLPALIAVGGVVIQGVEARAQRAGSDGEGCRAARGAGGRRLGPSHAVIREDKAAIHRVIQRGGRGSVAVRLEYVLLEL